jgi:hypothetical protein
MARLVSLIPVNNEVVNKKIQKEDRDILINNTDL